MGTDFTFGLTFDPADRPARPGAMREGPQGWRAFIGGVRSGQHFYDWQSDELYRTCAEAKAIAQLRAEKSA